MSSFRIFFAHRSTDRPRAIELKNALGELLPNLPIEDLSDQVPQSTDWRAKATQLLEGCHAVVCVVGPNTHESPDVAWEVLEAQRHCKPILVTKLESAHCLHPSCEKVPAHHVDWQPQRIADVLVTYALFAKHDWSKGDPSESAVWNQYNLMVQTSEALVLRRQSINTMYITANSALLAGIGAIVSSIDKIMPINAAWGVALISLLGALLSYNWYRTIISYGILNRAKFKVIAAIEQYLPARIFDAEWRFLEASRYTSTTSADKQSAWFFLLLFCAVVAISIGAASILSISG